MKKKKVRVLVCEDNSLMLHGLRYLLEKFSDLDIVGYARNGNLAVARARELEPDIILMDLGMPELDGISATKIIKAEIPAIRILVVSALDEQKRDEALHAGADGFFPKPVMDAESLYYAILNCLEPASSAQQ